MISSVSDLFDRHPPKPTVDLCLTYSNVVGVSSLLGRLLLLNPSGGSGSSNIAAQDCEEIV